MLRRVGDMAQATTLLDLNGRAAFTIFKEQRIEVPLAKVSPLVRKAILSIEDQRFYEHSGVDTVRIVGSAIANCDRAAGAGRSTLTQQLARQSFLTLDKTYRRKFQEIIVAAELESEYLEGRDPRAVPEQGVFRRRAARHRGRRARLLRQARD